MKNRIFGLDIMRCVAILFVMFAHTAYILPVSKEAKVSLLMLFGFSGVEFFFILSGFLVGKILLELFTKEPPNFRTVRYFWVRRWFRTLPAYYLALLLHAWQEYYTTGDLVFSNSYNLLYFIFSQNLFSTVTEFFKDSWSLSIEEWFYLLLPLWLLVWSKFAKGKKFALPAILTWIIADNLLRIFVVYQYNPAWNLGVRIMVPLRLDSLMTGVLMAYLYMNYREKWEKYATVSFVSGIVILAASLVLFYYDAIVPSPDAGFTSKTILFTVVSCAIALCLPYLTGIKTAGNRFIGAAVTHISLISYSLYLIHWIAIFVFRAVCYKWSLPRNAPFIYIGSWVVCIIAATIMYRFYEKPFTDLRERFKQRKRAKRVAAS